MLRMLRGVCRRLRCEPLIPVAPQRHGRRRLRLSRRPERREAPRRTGGRMRHRQLLRRDRSGCSGGGQGRRGLGRAVGALRCARALMLPHGMSAPARPQASHFALLRSLTCTTVAMRVVLR